MNTTTDTKAQKTCDSYLEKLKNKPKKVKTLSGDIKNRPKPNYFLAKELYESKTLTEKEAITELNRRVNETKELDLKMIGDTIWYFTKNNQDA